MRKKTKNRLAMYKAVKTVIAENNAAWTGLQAFADAFGTFSEKVELLEQHSYNQSLALVGVSAVKDVKKEMAADRAHAISSSLGAYAVLNSDVELINQMKISHYDLRNAPRSRVIQLLDLIIVKATEHVNDLGAFGVDQAGIDELQLLRDELDALLSAPRNAIISRKVLTQQIRLLERDIDALLKLQMDKLMVVLKQEHPDFFAAYRNARIIIDRPATLGSGEQEPPDEGHQPGTGTDPTESPDHDDGA